VALVDAVNYLIGKNVLSKNPIYGQVASVSVGIYQGTPILDLDYAEDSNAETDMNVVMNEAESFIEIQGTAEKQAFTHDELITLLNIASTGINEIIKQQKSCLGL